MGTSEGFYFIGVAIFYGILKFQQEFYVEETLASINDLSEDTRREMDDIYIALTEMAKNKSESLKRNPIGFVKNKEK